MHLIERLLPRYQFAEQHALVVAASPAAVLDAIPASLAQDDPLVQAFINLREAPSRLLARFGRASALPQRPMGLHNFTWLGRDGDHEIAYGLAGHFWHADYGLVPVADAGAFEALRAVPRLVLNFSAVAAPGGTLLTTQTRVDCPDAATRRRFTPYWLLIRPVSGLIRRRMLQRVRSVVEGAVQGGAK